MTIYPDLEWYAAVSERKKLVARCPYATPSRCPRYFESVSLLSKAGIMAGLSTKVHDELLGKWEAHELWPSTAESATSISGGKKPNCFSNFCPEVSFDAFKLFASTVIGFYDELDRDLREQQLARDTVSNSPDWRRDWEYVEPRHYSECPLYAKLHQEKQVTQINFHGSITGQVNVAGESISSPVLHITVADIISKIESSDASPEDKETAKSLLQGFLAHPLVAAIAGGLVGKLGS